MSTFRRTSHSSIFKLYRGRNGTGSSQVSFCQDCNWRLSGLSILSELFHNCDVVRSIWQRSTLYPVPPLRTLCLWLLFFFSSVKYRLSLSRCCLLISYVSITSKRHINKVTPVSDYVLSLVHYIMMSLVTLIKYGRESNEEKVKV